MGWLDERDFYGMLVTNEAVAAEGARLPARLGVKLPATTCAVRVAIFPMTRSAAHRGVN
jgi:hypothetical protein